MSLLMKNKLGFVDGSITKPNVDNVIHPFWKRYNTMVLAWILRSISPTIAQIVLWTESTPALWNKLWEPFSDADLFRVSDL